MKKGKDNANFKTNGQFSNIWGKERRNREFIFLTSLISLSFSHTVTSMIWNVTSMTVFYYLKNKIICFKLCTYQCKAGGGGGGGQGIGWGFDCLCCPWGRAFGLSCSPGGGENNQGFLQPGVLTSRDSYNQRSYN